MDSFFHRWLKIPYTLHITRFSSPKRPKATLILIHGIGNSAKAWEGLIPMLPKNIRVIGIDLLGFGRSPKPIWATYDAKTQARSVNATLLRLGITQRPIIVGHSLGALVAVELAKRYRIRIKRLILCSPPFYHQTPAKKRLLKRDDLLKNIYRQLKKYPQTMESLSPLVVKLKLATDALDVNSKNVGAYIEALESSIINQTALDDAATLKLPISVLYGTLDPFIIGSNIRRLANGMNNVVAKKIVTGHEIKGRYTKFIAKEIGETIAG